jgi:hypothetical protein
MCVFSFEHLLADMALLIRYLLCLTFLFITGTQSEDGDSLLAKREAAATLALDAVQRRKNLPTGECIF